MSDPIDMLDRTTSAVEDLLADFDKELLTAPTPCTEWTVSELLDHLVLGARMFASVASGNAPTTDAQQSEPLEEPRLRYNEARTEMVSAWRRRGLDGELSFGPFAGTPVQVVCTTATWDHLTHGWDLAQALGKPYHVDDDILAAATRSWSPRTRKLKSSTTIYFAECGGPLVDVVSANLAFVQLSCHGASRTTASASARRVIGPDGNDRRVASASAVTKSNWLLESGTSADQLRSRMAFISRSVVDGHAWAAKSSVCP
jgi:uncharacterized protein (TIGR03086 family)